MIIAIAPRLKATLVQLQLVFQIDVVRPFFVLLSIGSWFRYSWKVCVCLCMCVCVCGGGGGFVFASSAVCALGVLDMCISGSGAV